MPLLHVVISQQEKKRHFYLNSFNFYAGHVIYEMCTGSVLDTVQPTLQQLDAIHRRYGEVTQVNAIQQIEGETKGRGKIDLHIY